MKNCARLVKAANAMFIAVDILISKLLCKLLFVYLRAMMRVLLYVSESDGPLILTRVRFLVARRRKALADEGDDSPGRIDTWWCDRFEDFYQWLNARVDVLR